MRRIGLFACVLLIGSCSLPTESSHRQVEFSVGLERLAIGDTLTATLLNRSEHIVEYSFCPTALERRTSKGWLTVQQPFGLPAEPRSMCVGIAYELPAGESAEYRQVITEEVHAGRYRLRLYVSIGDDRAFISTSEFRVTR